MKTKLILGGAAIFAIAGGVMFCGDAADENTLTNEPSNDERVADDDTQRQEPEGDGPLISLQLGAAGTTTPVFWSVRIDNKWQKLPEYAGKVKFRVEKPESEFAVLWACETVGEDGAAGVHTTLVEATPYELSSIQARCANEGATTPVEVTGAIRNVDGQSPTLMYGTKSEIIKNEKAASDVLFSTTMAAGTQAFVAKLGDGEKAKFAVARNVEVKEGVNVEIDIATGSPLQAKAWGIQTDAATDTRFGEASVWMDGRTRVFDDGIVVRDGGVITRATASAEDYVDLRADMHGEAKDARAAVRYITRANSAAKLPMPALTWVGPSYARFDRGALDVSWSRRNWAVLGRTGDNLALFMPIAYVATVSHVGPNFRFDLVVTPRRATGKTPYFNVREPSDLENWEDRFWFTDDAKLSFRAGNLTAYAGVELPDAGAAIAAYLDEDLSPADLGANDIFAVVMSGAVTVQIPSEKDLVSAVEDRCVAFYGCEPNEKPGPPVPGSVAEMAKSVASCPDLEAWEDCELIEQLPSGPDPSAFEFDLRREIARWYTANALEGGVELEAALEATKAENVKPVAVPEGAPIQVFEHADSTRADSGAKWYGAYLDGRLISLHPLNWDTKTK